MPTASQTVTPSQTDRAAALTPSAKPTLTKIVATIGPASDSPEMIEKLILAGVSIFRFNFSHGTFAEHEKRLKTLREAAVRVRRPVAAMRDLQGPKIRVGQVPDGGIELHKGEDVVFRVGLAEACTEEHSGQAVPVLPTTYEPLIREVEPGQRVLINDGAIRMLAVDADPERGELRCRVLVGGLVTTGKGINLPESEISAPALTDRDWECVSWAVRHELDFLAMSFVRKADEVRQLKERLAGMCPVERSSWDPASLPLPVIAKIEKPEAVEEIEAIVDAADAIMVARGDLGVEMDLAMVPVLQKKLIAECSRQGKPCIVATQMLETMIENASPTRAEVSDVANAIFDGADAVMLSAESAVGKHPDLVVETMIHIARATEQRMAEMPQISSAPEKLRSSQNRSAALAHGAWHVAQDVGAKLVVTWSQSGETARYLSQNAFSVPIIAYTSNRRSARRMCLLRGVTPLRRDPPQSGRLADWNMNVDEDLLGQGWARPGETVVLMAGKPLGHNLAANLIAVHYLGTKSGFMQQPDSQPAPKSDPE